MKRWTTLLCLLLLSQGLWAAGIVFLDNPVWTSVLEQAKKENKIIFFDAYATWCGPCKMMDEQTYTDSQVAEFYNRNFINVKYDMEKGEGPLLADRYYVNAYPNLIFISPEGILLHKAVGFLPSNEFLALGQKAIKPESQYYSLKKNALSLNSKEFLDFAKSANQLQDEDFNYLGTDYLAKQSDILADSYLIELVMNYLPALAHEKDLAYLKESKTKVLREGKYTDEDFEDRLTELVMQYALSDQVQQDEEIDYESVKKLLDKYVPEKAFMALQFFKAHRASEEKNTGELYNSLNLILDNWPQLGYQQTCNVLGNFAASLYPDGKLDEILSKFDRIKPSDNEKELYYLKDLVKSIIYLKTGQKEKFKANAALVMSNANTPELMKKQLKEALEQFDKVPEQK